MNIYKVIYETPTNTNITFRDTWRITANSKQEAIERVLAVCENSKVITARKMPTIK